MSIATVAAAASSSLSAAADVGQMKSFSFSFPSCWAVSYSHHKLTPTPPAHCPWRRKLSRRVICEVAAADVSPSTSSDEATAAAAASSKIGSRVTVKVPLKVYHVPRVPEVDLTGMEGELKQYVGLWKGKRISANLPYKVQFVVDVQGRGVKFFAHLKEDEFEYL